MSFLASLKPFPSGQVWRKISDRKLEFRHCSIHSPRNFRFKIKCAKKAYFTTKVPHMLNYKCLLQCIAVNGDSWWYIEHTSLFLTLILGRDVEQLIFNVETILLISTSGKQPISTSFQHLNITLKQFQIAMFKQRQISILKQRQISTLIHFNEIQCLFNVEIRRCFNVVSACICLLSPENFMLKDK